MVRHHVFGCEECHKEFVSLQIVKRLLGSLESVDATDEWSAGVTAVAYAGRKPWWERRQASDSSTFVFEPIAVEQGLSLRGRRTVRVLALSAVVVFLAASPFAKYDHGVTGVTGSIAASMGMPMLIWPSAGSFPNFNTLGFSSGERPSTFNTGYSLPFQTDMRQGQDLLRGTQEASSDNSELTLTVSGAR